MLTKQQKQEWLDALNSGKYVRARGTLKRDFPTKHCCLGVLNDITPASVIGKDHDSHAYAFKLLGSDAMWKMIEANESLAEADDPTYSRVIPIIEALPTSD